MHQRLAVCFSSGIRAIRHIEQFLAVDRLIGPGDGWSATDDVSVVVWGRKKNTEKALEFASQHGLRILYLEDGFIRTCASDSHSRLSYSLVVDRKGVYYDATTRSELEQFLSGSDAEMDAQLLDVGEEVVEACLQLVIEHNITKYNYCSDSHHEFPSDKKTVLVVDQTYGDASVVYGGLDEKAFVSMLDSAICENPGCNIVVKTHPDVIQGRRKGYLTQAATVRGISLISEAVNPLSLLKKVHHVYVATSQLGMEALLCNKRVSVFGRPFYAGWGLTDDRLTMPGRSANRSLLELFFAAYFWYPRYCNPVTGVPWTLPECLQHVLLQKRIFAENSKRFLCVGFTPWKRRYISNYLRSPSGKQIYSARADIAATVERHKCDVVATWGYRDRALRQGLFRGDCTLLRVEDGFIRSTGLGSDFHAPSSLVFDDKGLYFDATTESNLQWLLNNHNCTLEDSWRAKNLVSLILSSRLSKYNLKGETDHIWSAGTDSRGKSRSRLLVVGQVENDASLRLGGVNVRTNLQLLEAVRSANPEAEIVYKPHPDVIAGNRPGHVPRDTVLRIVDRVVAQASIIDCIDGCDELHTITSLSGFEALLRGKQVVTYGCPFYAGWGLTTDRQSMDARRRARTLEELVYCTLIAYPRYMDIDTGEFATPEDMIIKMTSAQMDNKNMSWSQRQLSKVVNVYKGLSYAP